MTKREFFELVIAGTHTAEMVDFAKGEIATLDARNAKRATKAKGLNEPFKALILDYLADKDFVVGADIAKALDMTTQKVVGLCGSLVKGGFLERKEVAIAKVGKRIAYKVVSD